MGQKHSSHHKKKSRPSASKVECTEIVDIEFTDCSEIRVDRLLSLDSTNATMNVPPPPQYPQELLKVITRIEEIDNEIKSMTDSQMHLYFPTLKDDLHNNWEKVYSIKNPTDEVKEKKVETIEKIKLLLKNLNERFLKRNSRNILDR